MKPRTSLLALSDGLGMVRLAPTMPHVWHRLYQSASTAPEPQRQAAIGQARAQASAQGPAGFLAATFAFGLSGDTADLAAASRNFLSGALPADAGLALLHTIYSHALATGQTAAGHIAQLRASGFLQVLARLGLLVSSHPQGRRQLKPAATGAPLRRVALVAPTLSSALHAPTDLLLKHANALIGCGLECAVFSPQEFQMLDMAHWLGVPRAMRIDPARPGNWPRPPGAMSVQLARDDLSMVPRWLAIQEQIAQFDPQVVLFIGPYSPLLFTLHGTYPVAAMGTNALAPIGPMDLWLAPEPTMRPTWAPEFVPGRVAAHGRRFSVAVAAEPRARHDLGLAEGVVTWVTSGTRLAQEVSSEWLQAVLGTLARHPDCRWLIVGRGHDQVAGLPVAHPQILRREFDDQLPSLFKACDIYLNPPRLGGGHSVVTAMAQGLPVLSLRDSDGGDKLGPAACNDLADYFQALERLAGDSAARAQFGRQARERYLETLDLAAGAAGLVQALQALVSGSPLARA